MSTDDTTPATPLLTYLRTLDKEQRDEFSQLCDTPVTYLYALSGLDRGVRISAVKAFAIEDATRAMRMRYGDLPIITARDLATTPMTMGLGDVAAT